MQVLRTIRLNGSDTNQQTSTVGEPSISNIGQQMLITGNWYASQSRNDGNNWNYINPYSFFPSVDKGFCCDQTLHSDPSRNLTFWLLQYSKTNSGNTLRLAVNDSQALNNGDWYWWDIVPSQINNQWKDEWFDYNHAALSDNYLYIVTNVFSTKGKGFTRAVVFRIPLDDLANSESFPRIQYFETQKNFSLRCTQGAQGVMYFACHTFSDYKIRLFEWAEQNPTATYVDIKVSPWNGTPGNYYAPGPDQKNWLTRCDPRITAGWVSNDVIGFMWSADKYGSRQFPYVKVVRIDAKNKQIIDEPDIWSPSTAYAYPDACPNNNGDVGITLFRGGGQNYPGHIVGVWNENTKSWVLQAIQNGTNGPSDGKWGDYVTCRKHFSDQNSWLAVGFTLQGGGERSNVEPCIAHFSP